MYKQKLTLDPKLAEICEATLTVCDAEPLQQETLEKAANFKVLGCSKLSEQEMNAHKLMRAAAPLATGQKDVAVTELKCVSVEGNVLPAEFQMHYVFHVANYSNEAIASVPVTIYFNTPDHALVEQGTTTVKNIPAGHYQALEFTFPGVVAGQWKMSMEANKPRAFEESNYTNNLLSRTFTYVNKAELMAESVSALDSEPKYDSEGHQILYYDVPTTLEFVLSNVSAIDAKNVLVQVPAAFEDATGAHPAKLAETRMDVPAHTRRTLKLNITFNKPATAQIGLLLNNDRACDEVNYENNETHEIFSITKYNPGDKANYLTYPTTVMNITQSYNGNYNHYQNSGGTPKDYPIDEACEDSGRSWFYCPCDEMKVVRIYTEGSNTVWLESTSPVVTPSGTYSTITMLVTHPEDEDEDVIPLYDETKKTYKTFKRGEPMFREGMDGWATGNHFHISVGTGHYNSGANGTGWEKNSSGAWVLTPTGKTLKPEEAFYVDSSFTTIINNAGINFQFIS